MPKDPKDNIVSIRSDSKSASDAPAAGRPRSKYIPPTHPENQSEFYILPDNQQIIQDFKLSGGNFDQFLSNHVKDDMRGVVAVQIMEQLSRDPQSLEDFDQIRMAAERASALLAKDHIVTISKIKGPSQITALKLVQEFTKEHKGRVKDAIDKHLDEIPEDED